MRVVHCKRGSYDIYIGRGSIYGNPFSHKHGTKAAWVVDTRDMAIECHLRWLRGDIKLSDLIWPSEPPTLEQILELDEKTLGCWCHPSPCHGENYIQICKYRRLWYYDRWYLKQIRENNG